MSVTHTGRWSPANMAMLPPGWLEEGAAVTLGARG